LCYRFKIGTFSAGAAGGRASAARPPETSSSLTGGDELICAPGKQTAKADMKASGTLRDEGSRRFAGSQSVIICLGWQTDWALFDSASLARLSCLVLPLRDRRPSGNPGSRGCLQTYLTTWCMSWMTITMPEASKKSTRITRILRAARQNATHAMASAMMKGIIFRFLTGPGRPRYLHPASGIASSTRPCMVAGTTEPSTRFGFGAGARSMGQHRPCFCDLASSGHGDEILCPMR
jgi:hypothetical protein